MNKEKFQALLEGDSIDAYQDRLTVTQFDKAVEQMDVLSVATQRLPVGFPDGAHYKSFHLHYARGADVDFSNTTWSHVTFWDCDFGNADFRRATLDGCTFFNCNLQNVNMQDAKVQTSQFFDCNFRHAKLQVLTVPWSQHEFMSARLLQAAPRDFPHKVMAAGMREMRNFCWVDFDMALEDGGMPKDFALWALAELLTWVRPFCGEIPNELVTMWTHYLGLDFDDHLADLRNAADTNTFLED